MLNTETQTPLDVDTVDTDTPVTTRPERMKLAEVARINHILSDGVYIKAFIVPKGLKLYTKRFPDNHVSILAKGSVIIDNGNEKLKITAPMNVKINAMTRYQVFTLEDSVWYCVHANPTDETDTAVLSETY
jgi:hypothetical protein